MTDEPNPTRGQLGAAVAAQPALWSGLAQRQKVETAGRRSNPGWRVSALRRALLRLDSAAAADPVEHEVRELPRKLVVRKLVGKDVLADEAKREALQHQVEHYLAPPRSSRSLSSAGAWRCRITARPSGCPFTSWPDDIHVPQEDTIVFQNRRDTRVELLPDTGHRAISKLGDVIPLTIDWLNDTVQIAR